MSGAPGSPARPADPAQVAVRADSLLMGVTYALGIGSALTVSVLATRVLSKSDVALLGWCLASAMLLAVLAGLGTPQASIRLWTRSSSGVDPGQFARLLSIAATGTVLVVVVWSSLVGPALVAAAEGDYGSGVFIVALWVPAGALMMLNEAAARSQMNFRLAAFCGDWVRRSLVVFGLALVGAGVFDVTTGLVCVALVEFALACGIALVVGGLRPGAWARSSVAGIVRDARVSVTYLPPSLVAVLVPQAGVWLCALVAPPNEVADLSIAIRASFLVNVPFYVGGRVFAPRIADADELSRLEPAMRRFATLATGFAATVTIVFLLVGEELISLAFGSAYRPALPALLVLTVGQLVTAAAGLCGQCLAFRGQSAALARITTVSAVLFVPTSLLAGSVLGDVGVALAATLVVASQNVVMVAVARRRLGVNTLPSLRRLAALGGSGDTESASRGRVS